MGQRVGLVQGLKRLDQVVRIVTGKGIAANLRNVAAMLQDRPVAVVGTSIVWPRIPPPAGRPPARPPAPRPQRQGRRLPRPLAHHGGEAPEDLEAIVSALRRLGFRRREVEQAITQAHLPPGASLEEKVRATLQGLGGVHTPP